MLDAFGKLAIVELIFYPPILLISFIVLLRTGLRRGEGWVFLCLFSSVRVDAAILSLVSKTQSKPPLGLLIAVDILQAVGLNPLLHATLGFTMGIADFGLPQFRRLLQILRVSLMTGVTLAIIGGIKLTPGNSPSNQALGHTLSKTASIVFLIVYIALCGMNLLLWGAKEDIPPNHRKFLRSMSCSLPFLAVRVLYSILGAFVKSPSKWSPVTGEWQFYFVMGLIMEYIVASTYIITGAFVPLHKDEEDKRKALLSSTSTVDVERYGLVNQKLDAPAS